MFFHRLSPSRGEKGINGLFWSPTDLACKDGAFGVYFAKMSCKIEVELTIFSSPK